MDDTRTFDNTPDAEDYRRDIDVDNADMYAAHMAAGLSMRAAGHAHSYGRTSRCKAAYKAGGTWVCVQAHRGYTI